MRRRARALVAVAGLALTAVTPAAADAQTQVHASTQAQAHSSSGFLTRSGSHLMLDDRQFRYSGANVEWLGLVGYGPLNFDPGQNERYPSHYEIDDVLATAKEMGATVIRAQTLGDTVGCGNCLEPSLGKFNPQAFDVMDYALMRAHADGIKLILEFQGDARAVAGSSTDTIFSKWRGGANFYTDPTVIGDFENHIEHVVDHVNSYNGLPYKDDPTIAGWMDCNACGTSDTATTAAWVSAISGYVKHLDPNHLFFDNSGSTAPQLLAIPTVDVYGTEIYPHWAVYYGGLTAQQIGQIPHEQAAQAAAAGKAWADERVRLGQDRLGHRDRPAILARGHHR